MLASSSMEALLRTRMSARRCWRHLKSFALQGWTKWQINSSREGKFRITSFDEGLAKREQRRPELDFGSLAVKRQRHRLFEVDEPAVEQNAGRRDIGAGNDGDSIVATRGFDSLSLGGLGRVEPKMILDHLIGHQPGKFARHRIADRWIQVGDFVAVGQAGVTVAHDELHRHRINVGAMSAQLMNSGVKSPAAIDAAIHRVLLANHETEKRVAQRLGRGFAVGEIGRAHV